MRKDFSSFGDFRCLHCHVLVSAAELLSGVNNRNHCPYCLWSCHLDLFVAGDRLSACKGQMKPIGLTMKKSRNKYRVDGRGELMLIHQCVECSDISINRIAADDDPDSILCVFEDSRSQGEQIRILCEEQGIAILGMQGGEMVYQQLYGIERKHSIMA
jgi:RNHCP domain-containing protein